MSEFQINCNGRFREVCKVERGFRSSYISPVDPSFTTDLLKLAKDLSQVMRSVMCQMNKACST